MDAEHRRGIRREKSDRINKVKFFLRGGMTEKCPVSSGSKGEVFFNGVDACNGNNAADPFRGQTQSGHQGVMSSGRGTDDQYFPTVVPDLRDFSLKAGPGGCETIIPSGRPHGLPGKAVVDIVNRQPQIPAEKGCCFAHTFFAHAVPCAAVDT